MADWKVIKTKIEIFEHPNGDNLNLGKAGTYQVVVQKGLYLGGEEVVFVPEKSVLTGVLEEQFKDYLVGPNHDRVKAIRLRKELSCGIILSPQLIKEATGVSIDDLPMDEDLSEILGITKYIAPVPLNMEGIAEPVEYDHLSSNLDVEQFGVYKSNFIEGERVIGTEKVHGSQFNAYMAIYKDGTRPYKWVSTKNYNAKGLHILEDEHNIYWAGANDINLFEMIEEEFAAYIDVDKIIIQVFGEVIPCQAFKYGQDKPTVRLFDIRINAVSIPLDDIPDCFIKVWVPILYDGPFEDIDKIKSLAKGMEQVSGTEANIKEGMVLRPYFDRRAEDSTRLMVKILNPKYKETGEEFN